MKDEEVALKITHLYFEEIARLGLKRQLDLDQMISAYFYTLKRLKGKEESVKKIYQEMGKTDKVKETTVETRTFATTETVPVVKEVTTITTETKKPSVSDILEK